jgi:hypothetical protein
MSATNARLGLALGGAVIGGFFGVPGLGLAIGSIAGALLFPGPDPPPALGPRLGDLQTQVSAYGNPIPIIYGTDRAAGNIIWNSKIREIAKKSSASGGGKGGAPKEESVSFEYRVDLQIGLTVGPIEGIKRIWANDQLFYDFENPPHARGINGVLYRGDANQIPDPLIEADKGVGNVPAYRGLSYFIFKDISLAPFQNGIPTFHFEIIAKGDPVIPIVEVLDSPSGGGPGRVLIDPDTGFIWTTRRLINKLFVWSCNNGLNKICDIDTCEDPDFLAHQPRFTAVNVDILGTVTINEVPARVWVGSNAPDSQPNTFVPAYATDGSCRELERIQDPMNASNFCWPGMVFVDQSSINLDDANIGAGPTMLVGVTNGACFFIAGFGLGPFGGGGGLTNDPNTNNPAKLAGIEHTADIVQGSDGLFYGVDGDGRIWEGRAGLGGYSVGRVVQGASSFATRLNSITYDPDAKEIYTKILEHPSLVIKIAKWDKDLNQIWEFDADVAADNFFNPDRIRYHVGVGDVWVVGRDSDLLLKTKKINKQSGGYIEENSLSANRVLDDFQPFPGAPFAIGTFSSAPGGVIKFPLGPGATPDPPTLASVVQDLVERTGTLTAADIDVTDLTTDLVQGYTIAQRAPVRAMIQPLMTAYFFDAVESDYKIKFVKRGNAPALVVPPEDLAARRDPGGLADPVQTDRIQENELPNQLDVRFKNLSTDYKIGITTTRRLIGDSQQLRTQDVPVVFLPDEAKAITDVLIHNAWFERLKKSIALGRKYLRLDPTDVITITDPDQGEISFRINQLSLSLPQLLLLEGSEEDTTVYSGFTFPAPVPLQPQPGFVDNPPVALVVMDIPPLRDIDNNTGVYVTAYAIGGTFQFAEILFSADGVAFGPVAAIGNEGAVGFANERLTWEGSFK